MEVYVHCAGDIDVAEPNLSTVARNRA